MPTYQYRCAEGHDLEVVQAFSDAALTECPECGAPLRKVYGSVGVVFKGSGFYRNDSRNSNSSSSESKSDAPAKTETSSNPSTETKAPAAASSGSSASSSSTTSSSSSTASSGSDA